MSASVSSKQTELNRQAAREEVLENMILWYMANAKDLKDLPTLREDKRLNGLVMRWLDPPIPLIENPLLVEEFIGGGDHWSLRLEPLDKNR